jgi:hypothetical protein
VIADCLENRFTSYDLCHNNHEWQVESTVQALLTSADDTPLGKVRPCDIHKLANSLKLRKAFVFDGIPNECLRHLLRRPLVHLTHFFYQCLWLSHFPKPWKEVKLQCCWNLVRTTDSLKIYSKLVSCLQQASYSRKLFWKESKGTLNKETCLIQASLVSLPITAWRFNVWSLWTAP